MSQFNLIKLEYSTNLQEFYQNLSHLPGFVLLESTDTMRGRYDIVSAYPYDRFKIGNDTKDPANELARLDKALEVQSSMLDLPFQGGAIGYISYDLGERLVDIISTPQPTLKSIPMLDLGLYDWAIIADHHLQTVSIIAANRDVSTPEIINEIKQLWQHTYHSSQAFNLLTEFAPLISQEEYFTSFNVIQQALRQGRSYQVNYTQPFHANYSGDEWQIYRKISRQNPVSFGAFIRTAETSILGFSPERFLLYDDGQLLTSPIKGTLGRSADYLEDERLKQQLMRCEKNKAENVMIVDLLRNDLGRIAKPGSVYVSRLCSIESYTAVHHLVSDIKADCLESVSMLQAFLSCFPGGSITGAPKLESMKIINEQEPYSRGVYCGSVGYFSFHGRFDTNIAIRTVTAKDDVLHLAAGGGIVIESKCHDEYRECYLKIAAIINGLK